MPKSNHRGASYAGHVDITPRDVAEPDWQPELEQSRPEPRPGPKPAPRTRTRKRA